MPKSYSPEERVYIKNRLKEEAANCIGQYGIRRTTVDELVKRVKIPKGTFYLFYKSKEMLLFEVILEIHDKIEKEMYQTFSHIADKKCSIDDITDILFSFFKMAEETPILKVLNSDEVELLARRLPPEVLGEHLEHDDSMVGRIFSMLPVKQEINEEVFSAAFRGIYFATLHKDEIGAADYDEVLRLLVKGIVMQLFDVE